MNQEQVEEKMKYITSYLASKNVSLSSLDQLQLQSLHDLSSTEKQEILQELEQLRPDLELLQMANQAQALHLDTAHVLKELEVAEDRSLYQFKKNQKYSDVGAGLYNLNPPLAHNTYTDSLDVMDYLVRESIKEKRQLGQEYE